MVIEQTVDVPPSREIRMIAPKTVPTGRVHVRFSFNELIETSETPQPAVSPTRECAPVLDRREALQAIAWAYSRQTDSTRRFAGTLKGTGVFDGAPAAIQRKMRNEWN
jgi:hypothetical protein